MKRNIRKEESAVSPVIGVILMVAITVILAAVIGAFGFGMGGSLKKTYNVGVTATQTASDKVDITFQGGPDANLVHYINVSIDGTEFKRAVATNVTAKAGSGTFPAFGNTTSSDSVVPVGTAVTLVNDGSYNPISSGRDHVVATATFLDGTKQIVLDTYV